MTVRIEADEDERYPAAAVNFEDEPGFGSCPGMPRFELSDEEAADLRRARDAWRAWETRLLAMLEPGSPPAGFLS
jgi:hypothetical protein